jgi:hypothetical protein
MLRGATEHLPGRPKRLLDPAVPPHHYWHWAPLPPLLWRLSTRSAITWITGRQGTIAPPKGAEITESAIEQHLLNP